MEIQYALERAFGLGGLHETREPIRTAIAERLEDRCRYWRPGSKAGIAPTPIPWHVLLVRVVPGVRITKAMARKVLQAFCSRNRPASAIGGRADAAAIVLVDASGAMRLAGPGLDAFIADSSPVGIEAAMRTLATAMRYDLSSANVQPRFR